MTRMTKKPADDPVARAELFALRARIKKMAKRWGYLPDELAEAQERAGQDPAAWTELVDHDERRTAARP